MDILAEELVNALDDSIALTLDEWKQSLLFPIKWINFVGYPTPIVLQSFDGPCPLLSVVNVLTLRGILRFSRDVKMVPVYALLHELIRAIVEVNKERLQNPEKDVATITALHEITTVLPALLNGMDVNFWFASPTSFEATAAVAVFDLLNIPMLHGLVVSPEDDNLLRYILPYSYNQLLEKAVVAQEWLDRQDTLPTGTAVNAKESLQNASESAYSSGEPHLLLHPSQLTDAHPTKVSADLPIGATGGGESVILSKERLNFYASWYSNENGPYAPLVSDAMDTTKGTEAVESTNRVETVEACQQSSTLPADTVLFTEVDAAARAGSQNSLEPSKLQEVLFIYSFLQEHSSQVTYQGFIMLNGCLRDGDLAVLFRFNHFNTLLKRDGMLYLLVTASSLQAYNEVVWEILDPVESYSKFCDEEFVVCNMTTDIHLIAEHGLSTPQPTTRQMDGTGATQHPNRRKNKLYNFWKKWKKKLLN